MYSSRGFYVSVEIARNLSGVRNSIDIREIMTCQYCYLRDTLSFTKKEQIAIFMSFSVLYWLSGLPGSRSVIRGTWSRDPPRVLISDANFHRPSSLQYDISSNRYNITVNSWKRLDSVYITIGYLLKEIHHHGENVLLYRLIKHLIIE